MRIRLEYDFAIGLREVERLEVDGKPIDAHLRARARQAFDRSQRLEASDIAVLETTADPSRTLQGWLRKQAEGVGDSVSRWYTVRLLVEVAPEHEPQIRLAAAATYGEASPSNIASVVDDEYSALLMDSMADIAIDDSDYFFEFVD